jgi:hypothetical protein
MASGEAGGMKPSPDPSYCQGLPAEIISHAVWLYHTMCSARFCCNWLSALSSGPSSGFEGGTMARFLGLEQLFEGRHFDSEIIVLCVRWYLRLKLSFRDLVEMMSERSLSIVHTTTMGWVHQFSGVRALREPLRAASGSFVACGRDVREGSR